MSNIRATPEQLKKAQEDFLNKTKTYFDILNAIAKNKVPKITYDLTTDFYSFSLGEDTEMEKKIKQLISEVRYECSNNLLNY